MNDGTLYRILVYRDDSWRREVLCVLLNAARYDELLREAKRKKNPNWYQLKEGALIDEQKMDFVLSDGKVSVAYGLKYWNPITYNSIENAVNDVFDVLDPMITKYEVTDSNSDFTSISLNL